MTMYLNLLVGYLDRARKLVNWTVTRSAFPCFWATARHISSSADLFQQHCDLIHTTSVKYVWR